MADDRRRWRALRPPVKRISVSEYRCQLKKFEAFCLRTECFIIFMYNNQDHFTSCRVLTFLRFSVHV